MYSYSPALNMVLYFSHELILRVVRDYPRHLLIRNYRWRNVASTLETMKVHSYFSYSSEEILRNRIQGMTDSLSLPNKFVLVDVNVLKVQ